MPPPKRRTKGGQPVHDGRVTRPARSVPPPVPPGVPPDLDHVLSTSRGARREPAPPAPPAASRRYTPPSKVVRFRPGWHKGLGFGLFALGVVLAVVNDVMLLQPSLTLLPGGHSELYLFVGVGIAAYSTWWFGWFDRRR